VLEKLWQNNRGRKSAAEKSRRKSAEKNHSRKSATEKSW
jgi:hypothetical protein